LQSSERFAARITDSSSTNSQLVIRVHSETLSVVAMGTPLRIHKNAARHHCDGPARLQLSQWGLIFALMTLVLGLGLTL